METPSGHGRRARLSFPAILRGWPFYYETAPLNSEEILLRAVPNTIGYFKQSMGRWAINPYAFEPHKKRDPDGISLFRADFTTPQELANNSRHPCGVRVARLTVRQFGHLNLTIRPDPISSELPGHVIVPDLRFAQKRTMDDKRRISDLTQKLAQFASESEIFCPLGLPDPKS